MLREKAINNNNMPLNILLVNIILLCNIILLIITQKANAGLLYNNIPFTIIQKAHNKVKNINNFDSAIKLRQANIEIKKITNRKLKQEEKNDMVNELPQPFTSKSIEKNIQNQKKKIAFDGIKMDMKNDKVFVFAGQGPKIKENIQKANEYEKTEKAKYKERKNPFDYESKKRGAFPATESSRFTFGKYEKKINNNSNDFNNAILHQIMISARKAITEKKKLKQEIVEMANQKYLIKKICINSNKIKKYTKNRHHAQKIEQDIIDKEDNASKNRKEIAHKEYQDMINHI